MNEQTPKEDTFEILKLLSTSDSFTQRDLSERIGFSLGKTNYLLKALVKRGLISVKNFTDHNGKLSKVKYILTNKGFNERLTLTYHFLQRKEAEYNKLKQDWEEISKNQELELGQSPT